MAEEETATANEVTTTASGTTNATVATVAYSDGSSTPPNEPPKTGADEEGEEEEPFDKDRAMTTIKAQREEMKAVKAELKEARKLAARVEELEAEKLSDSEKRDKKLAELEASEASWASERQELYLRSEFFGLAPRLQIADADLAYAALDRAAVEYDDDGKPTNLEAVAVALLEAKPILRAAPHQAQAATQFAADGGAGRTVAPAPPLTQDELQAARAMGMTPERYAAAKSERSVDAVLAKSQSTGT